MTKDNNLLGKIQPLTLPPSLPPFLPPSPRCTRVSVP